MAADKLTDKQKAISTFSKNIGVRMLFFTGNKKFHGAYSNGLIYLNADTETSYDWTFWHESFHWLAAKNTLMLKEIATPLIFHKNKFQIIELKQGVKI